jgi:hypothetical protein
VERESLSIQAMGLGTTPAFQGSIASKIIACFCPLVGLCICLVFFFFFFLAFNFLAIHSLSGFWEEARLAVCLFHKPRLHHLCLLNADGRAVVFLGSHYARRGLCIGCIVGSFYFILNA